MSTGVSGYVKAASNKPPEDPLAYLPRKQVVEYGKNRTIYGPEQPSGHVYVVLAGLVKVARVRDDGSQMVVEICRQEDIFGTGALIGSQGSNELAYVLENASVMSWSADEIEEQIEKLPRLGIALNQIAARRGLELQSRIQACARYKNDSRLPWGLLRLSERLGVPEEGGWSRIPPLTQYVLADYVGTSREIITSLMNKFRRLGYVRYSRAHISIHRDSLTRFLGTKL